MLVFTIRFFAVKDFTQAGEEEGSQHFCDQSYFAGPFLLLFPIRALVIMSKKMSRRPKAPGAG